jgi:hypothetical protein
MAYKVSKTYTRPAIVGHPWHLGTHNPADLSTLIPHTDMDSERWARIQSRHPNQSRRMIFSDDKLTMTIENTWETEQDWIDYRDDSEVQEHFKWVSDHCAMYEITINDRVTEHVD